MECKECKHTLSEQEIQANLCFVCGAILDPSLLSEEASGSEPKPAMGEGKNSNSCTSNAPVTNGTPADSVPTADATPFLEDIFSNSANKIKTVVKVLFVLGCLVSFIVGIEIWDDWGLQWLYSIIIWIVGPTITYIQGLLLYTFAQMAEDISATRKSLKK